MTGGLPTGTVLVPFLFRISLPVCRHCCRILNSNITCCGKFQPHSDFKEDIGACPEVVIASLEAEVSEWVQSGNHSKEILTQGHHPLCLCIFDGFLLYPRSMLWGPPRSRPLLAWLESLWKVLLILELILDMPTFHIVRISCPWSVCCLF